MRAVVLAILALTLCGAPALADDAKPAAQSSAPAKAAHAKPAKARKGTAVPSETAATPIRCRDTRTYRFTKCGGPYAEAVPVN